MHVLACWTLLFSVVALHRAHTFAFLCARRVLMLFLRFMVRVFTWLFAVTINKQSKTFNSHNVSCAILVCFHCAVFSGSANSQKVQRICIYIYTSYILTILPCVDLGYFAMLLSDAAPAAKESCIYIYINMFYLIQVKDLNHRLKITLTTKFSLQRCTGQTLPLAAFFLRFM